MAEIEYPYIPETITVHLGRPDEDAENITVPFVDYIKNVASSEIYPTWPENALRANIYVIITYVLNRIYTEWYRSRGYDFDITNSTQFDQAFVRDRDIFQNVSNIVDEIFNNYVVRQGSVEPYFTQFCDGVNVQCEGLSQWGTVPLAEQGLTPYEILQYYYGDNINIIRDAPVQGIEESYPGEPLKLGDANNDVRTIEIELNRIAGSYPAIPILDVIDGIFGPNTEASVRKFQEIFDLPQTGIVDKATWYKIKRYYTGVKKLTELLSEGITLEEASLLFPTLLREGDQGLYVRLFQYYLSVIAYYNDALPIIAVDGVYGPTTTDAVRAFQTYYGLPATGEMNEETWAVMQDIYKSVVQNLPLGYQGDRAKFYPGYVLVKTMRNEDVRDLQTYLALIGRYYEAIPEIPVTGYFGQMTEDTIFAFQNLFGLDESGIVGPVTWDTIAQQYNYLIETEGSQ